MVNKGIGGDVVEGLASRWTTDIIEENPDWVSIAIGINNVARASMTNQKLEDALNRFRDNYQEIISRTREETNARLILLEIFYVAEEDKLHRNYNITPYNEVIHELAEDFGSILVPVSSAFRKAAIERPDIEWTTGDGVHPTAVGHTLIALSLLETLNW